MLETRKSRIGMAWMLSVAIATFPFRYAGWFAESEIQFLYRPMCWLTDHRWACEERYGVQNICLNCGKQGRN